MCQATPSIGKCVNAHGADITGLTDFDCERMTNTILQEAGLVEKTLGPTATDAFALPRSTVTPLPFALASTECWVS